MMELTDEPKEIEFFQLVNGCDEGMRLFKAYNDLLKNNKKTNFYDVYTAWRDWQYHGKICEKCYYI